jgi:hypothetical protein
VEYRMVEGMFRISSAGNTFFICASRLAHSVLPQKSSINQNPPRSRYSRMIAASFSVRNICPTSLEYTRDIGTIPDR